MYFHVLSLLRLSREMSEDMFLAFDADLPRAVMMANMQRDSRQHCRNNALHFGSAGENQHTR